MPIPRDGIFEPVTMGQVALGPVAAPAYTVPGGKKAVVQQVLVTNTGAQASVFVSLVPRGQVTDPGNRILHDVDVPFGALAFDLHQVLEPGDTVVGTTAVPGSLIMTVGGVEFDFLYTRGTWDAVDPALRWDQVDTSVTWDGWVGAPGTWNAVDVSWDALTTTWDGWV